MAFITLRYYSEVLGMQRELYAIVPQRSRQGEIGTQRGKALEGKCLYLLHGLSDDHTIWMRRTSIERYAEEYGLTVIMPEGDSSFYTNMKHGGDYYTHIAKELPEIAREFFGVSGRREDSLIGGLSMGGYGALKIALRETGAYSACVALSPVTDLRYLENHPRLYDAILGEGTPIPPEENPIDLIDTHAGDPEKPDIFLAIGTGDFLYEPAQTFRKRMETLPYTFTYREGPGIHNWVFWDARIQEALAWLAEKTGGSAENQALL